MPGTAVGCCELVAEVAPWAQSRGQRPYAPLQSSTLAFAGDGMGCSHPAEGMGPLQAPKY